MHFNAVEMTVRYIALKIEEIEIIMRWLNKENY